MTKKDTKKERLTIKNMKEVINDELKDSNLAIDYENLTMDELRLLYELAATGHSII